MTNPSFSLMFNALADLCDQGSEEIAKTASSALRHAAQIEVEPVENNLETMAEIQALLLDPGALPASKAILALLNQLNWKYPGLADGRISESVAKKMLATELIGPTGMAHDTTCRVGLFVQMADVDYTIRTHAAEELFITIAGEAEWSQSDRGYTKHQAGGRIHHASFEPHASRTTGSAMIALWAWTGNLDFETYQYADAN